jgi:hypothetical protein
MSDCCFFLVNSLVFDNLPAAWNRDGLAGTIGEGRLEHGDD